MCLITEWKNPRLAKKDITIYKLIEEMGGEGKWRGPYYYFSYKRNKLYKTKIEIASAEEDISCFNNIDYNFLKKKYGIGSSLTKRIRELQQSKKLLVITKGFHASLSIKRLNNELILNRYLLIRGIVPKGSLYYKDQTGLIVSNQIILKEEIIYNNNKTDKLCVQ